MSDEIELTRRRVVTATGAAAVTAGLAGCGDLGSRSFEATPVRLPEPARDELRLSEVSDESRTTTRTVAGNEITVTYHVAVYERGAN